MKRNSAGFTGVVVLTLAVLGPAVVVRENDQMTPLTRVVELLKGLSQTIEEESKKEEGLFQTYMCWASSVVSQKEASNTAATSRIDALNTYISDLEAGRIELTTERVDLEKEIEALTGDVEEAEALRGKEEKDFQAAEAEMQQAVLALTQALDVIRRGTGQTQLLLSTKTSLNQGFAARVEQARLLEKAVEIGQKVLGKGDALFLRRVLEAEVPTKDWKKLNRKATFKMKYEARSAKIEALLQRLLENFSADLQEARGKETDAQELHGKLMLAKGGQKTQAQTALASLDKENGARSLSKTDALAERDALVTQVDDDGKYISDVQGALSTKKTEYKERTDLRLGELAAISQAISILHNDDARDLFKKSYSSQGYLFLQESSSVKERRALDAADTLRLVAQKSRDKRLAGLAILAASTHFDAVISAIDNMVSTLEGEESEDLQKKEACENDRAADTRSAITKSREIDELTDAITGLKAKIEEIDAEIKEKEASIIEIDKQLDSARVLRQREHEDYLVAKKDDTDAAKLVEEAKGVLEQFYSQNMGLLQKHRKSGQPFTTAAGEAPPPPPATWQGAYGGKKEENRGIVSILSMVKDDILEDMGKAQQEEDNAVTAYGETTRALGKEKGDLQTEIATLGGQKSGHESDVTTNTGDRNSAKTELKATIKKIKDATPFCDFVLINFVARNMNRKIELDGLKKAKAILQGATFATPADPNRELRPGDAFLQRSGRVLQSARVHRMS